MWIDGRKLDYGDFDPNDVMKEYRRPVDTKLYELYFKPKSPKNWSGRLRTTKGYGFEAGEFAFKESDTPPCAVRGYSIDSKHNEVSLDLSITATNPRNIQMPFWKLVPNQSHVEDKDHYRAVFSTTFDRFLSLQPEGNQLVLSYTVEKEVKQCGVKYNSRPLISQASITVPDSPEEQGALVNISGLNLQNVVKVFVADQEATIVGEAGSDFVVVKVTKGAFIREQTGIKIPVVLITKDGAKVSGVITSGNADKTTKGNQPSRRPTTRTARR
jgi:hypothetical protein